VPRKSLFRKYFLTLFVAVVAPLMVAGGSDAWFSYRDQREQLSELLDAEARLAATKIDGFLDGIRDQLAWTVQLPWSETTGDRRRLDALRLLHQAPAVESLTLVDAMGRERRFVSRIGLNRIDNNADLSASPAVVGALRERVWYGPVTFQGGSEPFMTMAVSGNRSAVGVTVAEVNLKFIWEVVSAIRIGRSGEAFVLDKPGRLVAHPDISLVLRADQAAQLPLRTLRDALLAQPGQAVVGRDLSNNRVIAAMAEIPGVGWNVIVRQPIAEAFAPIYVALWRTAALLVAGAAIAAGLAYALTSRLVEPIRVLEDGVSRIGAGQFDHRINLATSDEFERLASRFNEMAVELSLSQERSERISRLRRFLAPQVAELVDRAGDDRVLDGRRVDVAVLFCDLRGFTAFSVRSQPATVIGLLRDYYDALEKVVAKHEATLINYYGDGAMVLLNAPVACSDPALRAVRMGIDLQNSVQELLADWRPLDERLGFGVGVALGSATVGQIGSEGRLHYTAIGNVVNLASRLCSSADDGEILVDRAAALEIDTALPLIELDARTLKGFDEPIPVYALARVPFPARERG
jgi:adenylate cyclase